MTEPIQPPAEETRGYRNEMTVEEAAALPPDDPNVASAGSGDNHEEHLGPLLTDADDPAGPVLDAEAAVTEPDVEPTDGELPPGTSDPAQLPAQDEPAAAEQPPTGDGAP